MRILGYDITITKAMAPLVPVDGRYRRGGWYPIIVHEPSTGAWQRNLEEPVDTVLAYPPVYACITRISGDMAKMGQAIVEKDEDDIFIPVEPSPWTPFLRTPNRYQNRLQFMRWWMNSKLVHGNTYALKERDGRGVVSAAYILDPLRVTVLVAPDGSVFYELKTDNLAGLAVSTPVPVPAREMFHDRYHPLFHPLIGIPPLYAAWLSAMRGIRIGRNSLEFFQNGSQPSGVVTAPGFISQEAADRAKAHWETNFENNPGAVVFLGDGLKYEPMGQTAMNSQLIEQEKFTAEFVCSCFQMKPWMIGLGPAPNYANVEAIQQGYLDDCLQILINEYQACLSDGLELPRRQTVHLNLDDLLQMDTNTKMTVAMNGVNAGVFTPNEARARFNLPPKKGGDAPYLQQQYWPLEALTDRPVAPSPPALPAGEDEDEDDLADDEISEKATITARMA